MTRPLGNQPAVSLFRDGPTEALPVVADAAGRHRADPGDDAGEWREPRRTSRVTTALVAALLVALGFLAGVVVGRSAGPHTTGDTARPAATSPARLGTLR